MINFEPIQGVSGLESYLILLIELNIFIPKGILIKYIIFLGN